jgi:hypothetical protein
MPISITNAVKFLTEWQDIDRPIFANLRSPNPGHDWEVGSLGKVVAVKPDWIALRSTDGGLSWSDPAPDLDGVGISSHREKPCFSPLIYVSAAARNAVKGARQRIYRSEAQTINGFPNGGYMLPISTS